MKPIFVLRMLVIAMLSTLLCAEAYAQASPPSSLVGHGAPLSSKERAKFAQITRQLEIEAQSGYSNEKMRRYMAPILRRAETMANPKMQAAHDKVLRFLGINPNGNSAVYIFVSWSMPLPMLRAYAVEAMWTGGSLIFRGVPPGVSLTTFLIKDLRQLVYGKGASAVISIDPRLYDVYKVSVAPTIVLTTDTDNFDCVGAGKGVVTIHKKHYSFNYCPPLASNKYWKIAGAVTLGYALRAFKRAGCPNAEPFLKALRRGYARREGFSKTQQPFMGIWKNAPVPGAPVHPAAASHIP